MLMQGSMNACILWLTHHYPDTAHHVAVCQDTATLLYGHMTVHTSNYLSLIYQTLKVTHVAGYTTETHLKHALQALSFNVPVQDLMLNHLMLAALDDETQ
jgi:hypothetical protein